MVAIELCPISVAVSIMMTQVFGSALAGYLLSGEVLSGAELFSIFGGFCGVVILTNQTLFASKGDPEVIREENDIKKHPNYYIGIGSAIIYTLFSVLNYFEMRRMGKGVHSSIKTYYFGGLCTFFTMIYIAFDGIEMYHFHKIGTDAYPIKGDQLLSCFMIGFFSWANQESLSLCLTVVKQGVATTFNNIALIVSFFVDTFYFGRMVLP